MHSDRDSAIRDYLKAIEAALRQGNATEHTHRPALKTLIEALAARGVQAINEPKHIACGAPDFIVARGTVPLGYIEAKDVGADLNRTEKSEQLGRYRNSLANLVLTDYLGFRWYLDGELRLTAELPRPGRDGRIRWNEDAASQVAQLLEQFLQADIPIKATPRELATRMAGLAQLIRGLIEQTFKTESKAGELHAQRDAFRKVLLDSLTNEQFADMYAQTLCYGLFAARCNAPAQGFNRQIAASALPKTNPFLRKLFNSIAGPDLDPRIAWAVDQLADMLARADMSAILADFGSRTRKEDPVVHFYETFLAAYDPKLREARGVYYTPEPVVGYIVRSVDALLKSNFGMKDGLAHSKKIKLTRRKEHDKGIETIETHRLQILDPATGTGTFLYSVIAKIRERFEGNVGAWRGYVAEHLLPRLFGFELLMAPYAVAHMKLGLELEESGYDFTSNQRLGVFLTNSLEEAHELTGLSLFTQWLAEESHAASQIKREAPIMVVLGNPPYSGVSENRGAWIQELVNEYKREPDGSPLREHRHWLDDDYVKFIRFAQWRIEQTGHGILAFVTNHGYLDNPTFRGMRQSLMLSFDEIYLLDLHGNSKKKEKAPDGGKDENVFDIQQGVAIGIFAKHAEKASRLAVGEADGEGRRLAQVFHADLYGTREIKYANLDATDVSVTHWLEIAPTLPNRYFVPVQDELYGEYQQLVSIGELFGISGLGFQSSRDHLTVAFTQEELIETISSFTDDTLSDEDVRTKYFAWKKKHPSYALGDTRQWSLARARNELLSADDWRSKITRCLYRPFDFRWYLNDARMVDWPRPEVLGHMQQSNLALIANRQSKEDFGVLVSDCITERKIAAVYDASTTFPLWLYPRQTDDLLGEALGEKTPNLAPSFIASLKQTLGRAPSPEDALGWIYAILYTPSYRSRYADFLKREFPRVPLTANRELFARLVEIGHELIGLHTMEITVPRITGYPVAGSNEVVKVHWAPDPKGGNGRIYINPEQYFDGVPQTVWDMHIGGYRVAEKWLKDRKGRNLSYDDLTHYQAVIATLARTLELQASLDATIEKAGGWPLA